MKRVAILMLAGLIAGCGETDVDGGREAALDTTIEVEPVDLDTVDWFTEGRTMVFAGYNWIPTGEPVYDPAGIEKVGEFEGTPLYAEVGTMSPYTKLFVPLPNDYWQTFDRAAATTRPVAPSDTAPEGG